ncbi:MAG: methyltransferase domain-containing protein [Planctomycetales bacterium]|nr:methyltransferase domain-containing protein [Planctomycetales bacterium]
MIRKVVNATAEERAVLSRGTSGEPIYHMVVHSLRRHGIVGGTICDVGCGAGNLHYYLASNFQHYIGVDVVRYDRFPADAQFVKANLDQPLADSLLEVADVVVAVETIEHLENPRHFMRTLYQMAKPNGWVVVTTPNQLSLLSKLTLLTRNEFNAFRASNYPAHLTALLEVDLRRMARETRLTDVDVAYSRRSRIALTQHHWPHLISHWMPRAFSDNVLLMGRKASHDFSE